MPRAPKARRQARWIKPRAPNHQASGQVQNATDQVADLIRDQPLIAVGAAFVIGIMVGQLMARV